MKSYKYLIIGGGMTADAAVNGIRDVDERGAIGILSAEKDPPYKRPPLSKGLWTGKESPDAIWCGTESRGAEIIRPRLAVAVDPGRKQVTDDRKEVYAYEKLLLATGVTPRRMPKEKTPYGDNHVIYYRTFDDYRRLRALTQEGHRFAVIGGGFIGSEISAALAMKNKKVTLVFPEAGVGGLMLPLDFSRALTGYFEERGVAVASGCKPSRIDAGEKFFAVHLENGRTVDVDGIVAGIGVAPNTELAEKAGLEVKNGIVVDERLRTTNPSIFAAGDVANFYSRALGRRRRVEHEDNALVMGELAGRNMAGEEQPYDHLPFFYSDLFDVGYEAVGETDSSHDVVTRLRHPEEKGAIFYLREGRVRGIVLWNVFGKVDAGRELIANPGPHTSGGLDAWEKGILAG